MSLGGENPDDVHWRMRRALHAARSGGRVYVAHDRRLLQEGHYFYGWDHAPAWSISLPAHTFTVTVLRDPVARIVSLYRYLSDDTADDRQPFRAGRAERSMAADGLGKFLDRLPKEEGLKQLHMFSASLNVSEAVDRIRDCSGWFMTDEFDVGIQELGRRLNLGLPRRWDRKSVGECDVGREADRLAEMLRLEYELLDQLERDPVRRLG